MSENTYTVEITGEQAYLLAQWLSTVAQNVAGEEDDMHADMKRLVPVGKQCIEIAGDAGKWEEVERDDA